QILQRLAERLRAGPLGEADRAAFMASVDQMNLSAADKRRLADALLAVRTGSAR
ncbi:TPA: chorismate mutase, partial [Serratia marcescens]|nr:chorismate mutase [Serratia marcescens]